MGVPSQDIHRYTNLGSSALQAADLNAALKHFTKAYGHSLSLKDDLTIRACAFNLGAAYVALRKPKEGLSVLQRAIPPQNAKDSSSNGDLFFNFGLAYELIPMSSEAVKYYELSLEEYQTRCKDINMEASVALKLGGLYDALQKYLQAARVYSIAALAHGKLRQVDKQVTCLCQQASSLWRAKREADAVDIADDCMVLCQGALQHNGSSLGSVYVELGLLYTQCQDFNKACTCFELALPLSRGHNGNKKHHAVVLQNLGAVHNFLGDFQRAVNFHESAAQMHAELGNRLAQAQSFMNLAFAYSQLKEGEVAMECYLHALQAARDAGDHHTQWQSLEGLAAASFNLGNAAKAIKYFKMAISTLASSNEDNPTAQERLVGKLSDALRYQLTKGGVDVAQLNNIKRDSEEASSGEESMPNILVNGLERPPTRDEMRMIDELKSLRMQHKNTRKLPSEFDKIALGIGEYDSDSDRSLERRHRRNSKKSHKSDKDVVDSKSKRHSRKLARRQSSRRLLTAENQKRRGNRPLLLPEAVDSDEERKKYQKLSHNSSEEDEADDDAYFFGTTFAAGFLPLLDEGDGPTLKQLVSIIREEKPAEEPTPPQQEEDDHKPATTDQKLSRYEEELRRLQAEDSDQSQTPGPSGLQTLNSIPTESPRAPPELLMVKKVDKPVGTYEKPIKEVEQLSMQKAEAPLRTYDKINDTDTDTKIKEMTTVSENGGGLKVPSEDPLYATIKSVKTSEGSRKESSKVSLSNEDSPPPPPPPRREIEIEKKFKEKDEFLEEYQRKWEENMRENVGRPQGEGMVALPQRGRKQSSSACNIM